MPPIIYENTKYVKKNYHLRDTIRISTKKKTENNKHW